VYRLPLNIPDLSLFNGDVTDKIAILPGYPNIVSGQSGGDFIFVDYGEIEYLKYTSTDQSTGLLVYNNKEVRSS